MKTQASETHAGSDQAVDAFCASCAFLRLFRLTTASVAVQPRHGTVRLIR